MWRLAWGHMACLGKCRSVGAVLALWSAIAGDLDCSELAVEGAGIAALGDCNIAGAGSALWSAIAGNLECSELEVEDTRLETLGHHGRCGLRDVSHLGHVVVDRGRRRRMRRVRLEALCGMNQTGLHNMRLRIVETFATSGRRNLIGRRNTPCAVLGLRHGTIVCHHHFDRSAFWRRRRSQRWLSQWGRHELRLWLRLSPRWLRCRRR